MKQRIRLEQTEPDDQAEAEIAEQLEIILDRIDWSIESYLRQSVSIIS